MLLTARASLLAVSLLFISSFVFAQPGNDDCSNAVSLTSYATTCSGTTAGTVLNATNSSISVNSCGGTPDDDVWYKFTAQGISTTISLTNIGNGNPSLAKADARAEVFYASAGNCSSLSYVTCQAVTNSTSLTLTSSLTAGSTYYVRVFSSSAGAPTNNAGFDICVTHTPTPSAPANDDCANATALTIGTTNSSGTVYAATASSGIPVDCATGDPDDDVWYKFTATATDATITLSAIGSNLSTSGTRIQLFSGSCGSLTSLACGTTSVTTGSLTPGSNYYVRVYSQGTGSIGGTTSGSVFSILVSTLATTTLGAARMNEVFKQTTLSAASLLNDPWEITYGPDNNLWITEAKGYKVYKMDPNTGVKTTVLDISKNSTFLPASDQVFNVQFTTAQNPWPQGGFAGLVLHPRFLDATTPKNYVYVSYVYKYDSTSVTTNGGIFFTNRVVRFTYNTSTGLLESPVSLCDTLPGSNDHNSQRMIVAPVSGTYYLFYASGDMGAGQFSDLVRANKAQLTDSYEGKILRFNLEDDGDAAALDKWIPNDNPFNGTRQSAVWATGIRNNQGFAYANINGTDYVYGSSHGPFSDDEVNIIERAKNYGHPIVIGYSTDGNYDGAKAGPAGSSLPLITTEAASVAAIGSSYKEPIFSFYPAPKGNTTTPWSIQYIYTNQYYSSGSTSGYAQNLNSLWSSEAPSGMDIYTHTIIPGWKNSLLSGMLKGGKVMRLKLNAVGNAITPTAGYDTVAYFRSVNRFRDLAIAPDGKSIFTIIDKSSTTSGPTTGSPMISACAGCVLKFTFLGYANNSGRSTIPTTIDVTPGTANSCTSGTTITIDNNNNTLWVPITGPDGNIMAEIKANGNNLGIVTSSFYNNSGAVRENASKRLYLDRNITITPQVQPSSPVSIRLYITTAELNALKTATNSQGVGSGVGAVTNLSLFKNTDGCVAAMSTATPTVITPTYAEAHGSDGFVLGADVSSFSSFYLANNNVILPLQLLSFRGNFQNNVTLLEWKTANEINTSHFVVERSANGRSFTSIGKVSTTGNNGGDQDYSYTDQDAAAQSSSVLYYRLKMVDLNGSYTYSKIVSVNIKSSSSVTVYPNPIENELRIRTFVAKAGNLQIQVTDMAGRMVYSASKFVGEGRGEIIIPAKQWKSQTYSIKVLNTDRTVLAVQNVVKL